MLTRPGIKSVLSMALEDQDVEFNVAAGLNVKTLGIKQKKRHKWLDEAVMPEFFDLLGISRCSPGRSCPRHPSPPRCGSAWRSWPMCLSGADC